MKTYSYLSVVPFTLYLVYAVPLAWDISVFLLLSTNVCVCACVLFPYSFLSCPPSLTKLCCCLTFFPPECSCIFDSTKSRACIIWINQVDYATTYNNNKNKTPIKMNRLHLWIFDCKWNDMVIAIRANSNGNRLRFSGELNLISININHAFGNCKWVALCYIVLIFLLFI